MKNDTKTLSFRDLAFSVLHHWKQIVLAVLILAVLIGGVMGIQGIKALSPEARALSEQQYSDALSQYQHTKQSLTTTIAGLERSLEDRQIYMEKSVLMNVDYHNVYEANITLYVDTGYQVNPQLTYQTPDYTDAVVIHYCTDLQSNAFYQTLGEALQLEPKYVQELITVTRQGAGTIIITVLHSSESDATTAVELILEYVEALEPAIAETVGAHSVRWTLDPVAVTINMQLESLQTAEQKRLVEEIDQLVTDRESLNALAMPTKKVMTRSGVIKNVVKGVVIGAVLGGVLAVLWFAVSFLLTDKIYSGEALQNRFGIQTLGCRFADRKLDALSKLFRKAEGRICENSEGNDRLIGARAANCCSGAIILSGCADAEQLEAVSKLLTNHGVAVLAAGNLLKDGAVVEKLPESAGVVLVERCGKSTCAQVARARLIAEEAQKTVLAAIVID